MEQAKAELKQVRSRRERWVLVFNNGAWGVASLFWTIGKAQVLALAGLAQRRSWLFVGALVLPGQGWLFLSGSRPRIW